MPACCARFLPSLLLHLNICLAVYAGAALVMAARLKWDPSAYVPLRAVFPTEFRLAAIALPTTAGLLLLLVHLGALALRTRRHAVRRVLLLLYAFLMALMMCGEAVLVVWLRARLAVWARSAAAAELHHALALRDRLQPLLEDLAHWHPLPKQLKGLIQEAEEDAPRNIYVCVAAAALLAVLQAQAALAALLLAARTPRSPRNLRALRSASSGASTPLSTSSDVERAPLKTVYKRGRLVMV